MRLAMIGLGKMGANMTRRLLGGGHQVVVHDMSAQAMEALVGVGAQSAADLTAVVGKLTAPRVVWLMLPAGAPTDETILALHDKLSTGDIIVDGGNSNYRDSMRRALAAKSLGIDFVDVGTSGGIWGLKEGYSLMIGGAQEAVNTLKPVFQTLAPGADRGWGHVGASGAGHFTKMIHNGIEYGLMQAYAEGLCIMQEKRELGLDVAQITEIWRHGSVVRSWLLDLLVEGLRENPQLDNIAPVVADSGEGRWTVAEAIDLDVPAPVITAALLERLRSRQENSFTDRLLSLMRAKFGGHSMPPRKG